MSIHYLLFELGLNQDMQQNLYEEINSVIGKDSNITETHLSKLKYLRNVVKESAR
jgi:hypothetical protein